MISYHIIAYKQIKQIAEMSDLAVRISTIERSLQPPGQPFHWIGLNSEKSNSSEACLDGQRVLHSSFDHPLVTCPGEVQNGQIVQSTTADSCLLRRSLRLKIKQNPALYRTDSRFLTSPVE